MNWNEKIKVLEDYKKYHEKTDSLFEELVKHIAPDSYVPIISYKGFETAITLVANGNKNIEDWLYYYFYEAPIMMGTASVTTPDGKKYNFKKRTEFIRFLNENYE